MIFQSRKLNQIFLYHCLHILHFLQPPFPYVPSAPVEATSNIGGVAGMGHGGHPVRGQATPLPPAVRGPRGSPLRDGVLRRLRLELRPRRKARSDGRAAAPSVHRCWQRPPPRGMRPEQIAGETKGRDPTSCVHTPNGMTAECWAEARRFIFLRIFQ